MLLFNSRLRPSGLALLAVLLLLAGPLSAQYFGRNKVNYTRFDFRVVQSPNFEMYHYLDNQGVRNRFLQQSEDWYRMHQAVLLDTFEARNPMIIYNNHAHFQQTRAIDGQIGVGTGGVTEALKNRVILPFMESNAQTDHVLGHELVHAFQYHLIQDTFNLQAFNNLPLWMVEGLAEYMSIGYQDPHTALWLRDAVAVDKLPTLQDLTRRPDLYFPYRWGQAFWSYVTGRFGDTMIRPLFIESARRGYPAAVKLLFKQDEKAFSEGWKTALRNAYAPFRATTSATPAGRQLIGKGNAGELNIIPSLSPDGRLIAYWTEKNLFSIDLYIADAATGKSVERVTSNALNSHIDEYSSFESAVAWSPDSRQLAFVAFAKGRNRLLIANVNGKIDREIDVPGVPGLSNPTWSPDGTTLVFTGLVDGQSDLYSYNLENGTLRQLTNDQYADIQPSFSPDGRSIVFVTDRPSYRGRPLPHKFGHNLAFMELATAGVTVTELFTGADNMNPVWGPNNQVYFLSDRDGFRNLYAYDVAAQSASRLTNLFTGITGITHYSPAISVARNTGQVVYNYFTGGDYSIYTVDADSMARTPVAGNDLNMQAAQLPPFTRAGNDMVQAHLNGSPYPASPATAFTEVPFRNQFQLDYIGNTGVGIQTGGGGYGSGLAGGVNGIFSDILGNNQLFGALALNGEIYDIGGQFAFVNRTGRFNWGASLSHIPYLSGAQFIFRDSLPNAAGDSIEVINSSLDLLRTFEDQFSLFGSYPFSTIRRIEAGASFARYYYRLDRYSQFYDPTGQFYLGQRKERQETPDGFSFGQGYLALVGDNSNFGIASPLDGHRFRLEASRYLGVVNLSSITGDYRRYFRFAPVTLATRNMYLGRFGRDAESGVLPPLYLGYPTLIRGYEALGYAQEGNNSATTVTINDLIGSRIFVSNAELRLPFSGPERLSVIKSGFFLSELNLFTDGGIAWGTSRRPGQKEGELLVRDSRFILSSGVSLRVNLFGYLILEPYLAVPWQNGGTRNPTFGLNFSPGW